MKIGKEAAHSLIWLLAMVLIGVGVWFVDWRAGLIVVGVLLLGQLVYARSIPTEEPK